MRRGTVLWGVNNIFTVRSEGSEVRCTLKGKILRTDEIAYNPLAPGDEVEFETDPADESAGRIVGRLSRRSEFKRWNNKRKADQAIAANADLLLCVASPLSPPFRPRFVDRVLVSALIGGIEPVIVLNKTDQGIPDDVRERLDDYRAIGYSVLYCSAKSGEGIAAVDLAIGSKRTVIIGQSGTGKSSIINLLSPDADLRIGEVSSKHNRGRHTTIYSVMVEFGSSAGEMREIIDTPGIREIHVTGIEPPALQEYLPEIWRLCGSCSLPRCSHLHEPGCEIIAALSRGEIHPDRYESYCRIYDDLSNRDDSSYE